MFTRIMRYCINAYLLLLVLYFSHQKCLPTTTSGYMHLSRELDSSNFIKHCIQNVSQALCRKHRIPKDWGCHTYRILSMAASDPGSSDFYVGMQIDEKTIKSEMQRGFHVFQYRGGLLKSWNVYDTYANIARNKGMAKELSMIRNGTLVILIMHDAVVLDDEVKHQLKLMGAKEFDVGWRNAYCLVSIKGMRQQRIVERRTDIYKGPCYCKATVWNNGDGYFLPSWIN